MLGSEMLIQQVNIDSHFNYHYTVLPEGDTQFSKPWTRRYTQDLINAFGAPGSNWGYRIDANLGGLAVYFHNEEDALWFKMLTK